MRTSSKKNPFRDLLESGQFSARSQASKREQWNLEAQLRHTEQYALLGREKVAKLTDLISGGIASAGKGTPIHPMRIPELTAERQSEKQTLAGYNGRIKVLKRRIEEIAKTPAGRTKHQRAACEAAATRLDLDRRIAAAVADLAALLRKREGLTVSLRSSAAAAEMSVFADEPDQQRFDDLRAALPSDLAEQSELWALWFSGADESLKTYRVQEQGFTLGETLASNHCYGFRELVKLPERIAAPHLRGNRPSLLELDGSGNPIRVQPIETESATQAARRDPLDERELPPGLPLTAARRGEVPWMNPQRAGLQR